MLNDRAGFANVCNTMGIETAVEIGTHHGIFADQFMQLFKGTLTVVDPWKDQCHKFPTFYPSMNDVSVSREDDYRIAREVLSKYGCRVRILRKTSAEALDDFPDDSVGFVYIDGLHDYDSVNHDIWGWFTKVKPGGILAGHDYMIPDVAQAVGEFALRQNLKVQMTADSPPSWWVVKNG